MKKQIELERAFFGIGEENDIDVRDFLQQNNYKLEKNTQLTNHFGDPYPSQSKQVYVDYRIIEEGCASFQEFCHIIEGNKRIGYNQSINQSYELEIPNMYHYKVKESHFEIQDIKIQSSVSNQCIQVEREKWNVFVKEMENGCIDVVERLNILEWIGNDPFPEQPKIIQVHYKREARYWIQVYELGGYLFKDVILTAELPLCRTIMLFHFFPVFHHPLMELHLTYLKKALGIFDKVIVSIANSTNTSVMTNEERLRTRLGKSSKLEVIHTYNCRRRGEAVSFLNLINKVISQGNCDYVFYAHSKGFTHNEASKIQNIACWNELMYIGCLANLDVIIHRQPNFAGNFLKHGMINGNHHPRWHYSGSYYWIQFPIVQRRNALARYSSDYYIAERFPGLMCPRMDACLTFFSFRQGQTNLYDNKCIRTFEKEIRSYISNTFGSMAIL